MHQPVHYWTITGRWNRQKVHNISIKFVCVFTTATLPAFLKLVALLAPPMSSRSMLNILLNLLAIISWAKTGMPLWPQRSRPLVIPFSAKTVSKAAKKNQGLHIWLPQLQTNRPVNSNNKGICLPHWQRMPQWIQHQGCHPKHELAHFFLTCWSTIWVTSCRATQMKVDWWECQSWDYSGEQPQETVSLGLTTIFLTCKSCAEASTRVTTVTSNSFSNTYLQGNNEYPKYAYRLASRWRNNPQNIECDRNSKLSSYICSHCCIQTLSWPCSSHLFQLLKFVHFNFECSDCPSSTHSVPRKDKVPEPNTARSTGFNHLKVAHHSDSYVDSNLEICFLVHNNSIPSSWSPSTINPLLIITAYPDQGTRFIIGYPLQRWNSNHKPCRGLAWSWNCVVSPTWDCQNVVSTKSDS